jgi:hypothetical protein
MTDSTPTKSQGYLEPTISDPKDKPLGDEPWQIWLDQPITRRKSFHVLTAPDGSIIWRARLLSDLIAHLDILEVDSYKLIPLDSPDRSHGHVECNWKGEN